jgi:CRISPR type III-A-associated RAMP protein Csm4
MPDCLLLRLRPLSPWRLGPSSGARDRTDAVGHSDTLYSALCQAMGRLGWLEEWLTATALAKDAPEVKVSSLFPWQGDLLFVPAPRHLWPPANVTKLRASGADFVPSVVVAALVDGAQLEEDKWEVDGFSRCLIKAGRRGAYAGPFRHTLRSGAAVDRRVHGRVGVHQTACLEFSPDAGFWCVAEFGADAERWRGRIEACFRLLADSGIGGERSRGWGHFEIEPVKRAESVRELLIGAAEPERAQPGFYWLLSLFSPSEADGIDWDKGSYTLISRSGRVESAAGWGSQKKQLRMVREGSVVVASGRPVGVAHDVAPEGFPHPVFRAGFAVSLELTPRGSA